MHASVSKLAFTSLICIKTASFIINRLSTLVIRRQLLVQGWQLNTKKKKENTLTSTNRCQIPSEELYLIYILNKSYCRGHLKIMESLFIKQFKPNFNHTLFWSDSNILVVISQTSPHGIATSFLLQRLEFLLLPHNTT